MEYLITVFIVLLGVITYFLVHDYLDKKRMKRMPKPPIPVVPVNYENDITFLMYLISHKVKQHQSYLMTPYKIMGNSLINPESQYDFTEKIVTSVVESLSPNYLKILGRYFNEDGLLEFITEHVMNEVTVFSIENSFKGFKK